MPTSRKLCLPLVHFQPKELVTKSCATENILCYGLFFLLWIDWTLSKVQNTKQNNLKLFILVSIRRSERWEDELSLQFQLHLVTLVFSLTFYLIHSFIKTSVSCLSVWNNLIKAVHCVLLLRVFDTRGVYMSACAHVCVCVQDLGCFFSLISSTLSFTVNIFCFSALGGRLEKRRSCSAAFTVMEHSYASLTF